MEGRYAQRPPVSRTGAVLTTLDRMDDTSTTTPCTTDLENEDVTAWSFFSNLRRLVRTAREEVYGGPERRAKRIRVQGRDEQPVVMPRQAAATTSAVIIDNSTGVAQVTVTVAASDSSSSDTAAATSDAISTPVAPAATTTDAAAASSALSSYLVASTSGSQSGTVVDTASASASASASTSASASASASLSASASAYSSNILSNSSSITSSLFATTSSSAAISTSSTSFFTSPTVPAYTSSFIIIDSTSSETVFTSTAVSTTAASTTFAVVTSASSTETETALSSSFTSDSSISYTNSGTSATGTGANGFGGSATSTGSAAATSTGTSSDSGSGLTTSQQEIVGGVVGGLAGLAFILVGMLFVLRWYKRTMNEKAGQQALPSSESGGSPEMSSAAPPATAYAQSSTYGSHRSQPSTSTTAPLAASAITPAFFSKKWRNSGQTTSTADTGSTGFQKISGRKIPSVLEHGGDGYGTGYTDPRAGSLAGSSFYRDGEGFYGGPGPHNASTVGSADVGSPTSFYKPETPTYQNPTSPPARIPNFPQPPGSSHGSPAVLSPVAGVFPSLAGASALQNRGSTASEIAVIRPSPARTPTVQYDAPSGSNTPMRSPDIPPAMPRPPPGNLNATPRFTPGSTAGSVAGSDGIGRSHYDGSRESRFSERLTPTP